MKLYEGSPVVPGHGRKIIVREDPMNLSPRMIDSLNQFSFRWYKGSSGHYSWEFSEAMYAKATDYLHSIGYSPAVS